VADIKPDIVHFFHFSRLGAALIDVVRQSDIPAYYTPTDFWSVCPTSQLLLEDGSVCDGPSRHGGNCVKHVAMLTRWGHYSKVVRYLPNAAIDLVAAIAKINVEVNFPFKYEIAALSKRKPFNVSRLNALQGIVSPTQLMTDILVKNGVMQELITQSAYGINVSGYDKAQERFSAKQGITFGYIGTLAPHKGCHVLIQAFVELANNSARLKIYGNPNDFPDYVAELKQAAYGSDAIEFCGTFPNAQIAEVLAGIDALVVPSVWYENTPLVVYSALAAKCPVIASDFAGMSEVIHDGLNGMLFTPRSAAALSECLRRLMIQPELLNKLSKNCQPPKSISTYVDELINLYEKAHSAPKYNLKFPQVFEAFDPSNSYGHVAGWAVASQEEPKAIRIFDEDREVGQTPRLLPRPDVRDGLNSSGMKINTTNFGFTVNLVQPANRLSAILEIESKLGGKNRIPFSSLVVGQSVQFDEGVIVGLDEAIFPNYIQE
jgi:glycosyltransferase involved in cell wall biosynthesis